MVRDTSSFFQCKKDIRFRASIVENMTSLLRHAPSCRHSIVCRESKRASLTWFAWHQAKLNLLVRKDGTAGSLSLNVKAESVCFLSKSSLKIRPTQPACQSAKHAAKTSKLAGCCKHLTGWLPPSSLLRVPSS